MLIKWYDTSDRMHAMIQTEARLLSLIIGICVTPIGGELYSTVGVQTPIEAGDTHTKSNKYPQPSSDTHNIHKGFLELKKNT